MKNLISWFVPCLMVGWVQHSMAQLPKSNQPPSVPGTNSVPLTMELVMALRQNPASDTSVRTTNNEPVALFLDVARGEGSPGQVFAIIKPFDNLIYRSGFESGFLMVPWNLLYFEPNRKHIEIHATRRQLETTPLFPSKDLPRTVPRDWQQKLLAHFNQAEPRHANAGPDVQPGALPNVNRPQRQTMGRTFVLLLILATVVPLAGLMIARTRRKRQLKAS